MIESRRAQFNAEFSTEKYQAFLDDLAADFNYAPTFRIAETPFFIPNEIKNQLVEACGEVIDFIKKPDFKSLTQRAIDLNFSVPNEDAHSQFMAIDFGICEENGQLVPKLIEVQGFPSIFNFQFNLYRKLKERYAFLSELTPYLSGLDEESYLAKLREVVIKDFDSTEVILLEIEPEKQNTKIDFYYCHRDLGIPIVCVTEVLKEGSQLFYVNHAGEKKRIRRIYNRVIFDELNLRKDLTLQFSFEEELDVEWAGH
ncbi:MAG: hypothetical protein ABJC55_18865, partial [Algoriphagus sp.]